MWRADLSEDHRETVAGGRTAGGGQARSHAEREAGRKRGMGVTGQRGSYLPPSLISIH